MLQLKPPPGCLPGWLKVKVAVILRVSRGLHSTTSEYHWVIPCANPHVLGLCSFEERDAWSTSSKSLASASISHVGEPAPTSSPTINRPFSACVCLSQLINAWVPSRISKTEVGSLHLRPSVHLLYRLIKRKGFHQKSNVASRPSGLGSASRHRSHGRHQCRSLTRLELAAGKL